MTDINNTPEMNEEELDVVVMTDDEGNEYLYDVAARIEKNDNEYVVLVPQDEEDDEVVILKSVLVDDETEELVAEEDESITDAVFEDKECACPVEIGHRSATICHLANIAARLGRTGVRWDPRAERIVGDDEAGKMIFVKHHNGWGV